MKEDIISALREILRCYDLCNSSDQPHFREIDMWRERFLSTVDIPRNAKEANQVRGHFMYVPSQDFLKKSPEEILEELIKCNDEFHANQGR